jgi:mono/diheme cytochrome c family protein
LVAWNPVTQTEAWRVDHAGPWNGGVLSTAGGLVFQGLATGEFFAYDSSSGRRLWSFDTHIGIMAAPITYMLDGVQYVAVMAGYGGGYGVSTPFAQDPHPRPNGRLIVFAIDGDSEYVVERKSFGPMVKVTTEWPVEMVETGRVIYERSCSLCHGPIGRSSGVMPDLRRSSLLRSEDAWRTVVYEGLLEERGMIGFSQWLSVDEVESVRAYVAGLAARAIMRSTAE